MPARRRARPEAREEVTQDIHSPLLFAENENAAQTERRGTRPTEGSPGLAPVKGKIPAGTANWLKTHASTQKLLTLSSPRCESVTWSDSKTLAVSHALGRGLEPDDL